VTAAAPANDPFGIDDILDTEDIAEIGASVAEDDEDTVEGEAGEATLPPPLRRSVLLDEMPEEQFLKVVEATRGLLDRRFAVAKRLVDVASKDVNVNPFLMLAMAPAYNIYSPYEVAEYAQNAKLPHGDSTAFGKFVEVNIFSIFGSKEPDEKHDVATKAMFSPIDADLTVEGTRYFLSYKSGPWTMNQSHASEMRHRFPEIKELTGCDVIIGIFYGRRDRLNNKPALVRRNTGPYVHTLVGQELWEFVTGVKDAHLWVFKAIRVAQREFAIAHGGKTFFEHLIEARLKLAESFRDAFKLVGAEDDMWEQIFKGSF
jgi:Type II restriction endonuclease EcoO109I